MGELFEHYNLDSFQGKTITIGDYFPEVFVADSDEVFCYPGICLKDDLRKESLFMSPYYMAGKHSTDKDIIKSIKGFYRIVDGCIVLSDYVDCKFLNIYTYKKINAGVRFPCPDGYYGVLVDGNEDEELTRKIFGLTYREIVSLLEAYAKMMGTYSEYHKYPKLTRSIKNENYCDMTSVWIPAKFPYVAFDESGYEFSHVSLWGFYRYLQLMTNCKLTSVVSRSFLKSGVEQDVLTRLFSIGRNLYHYTKVTQDIIR